MRQFLLEIYTNIIQFWIKAEQLCSEKRAYNRSLNFKIPPVTYYLVWTSVAKSLTSARAKRLSGIIDDITEGGNSIEKLVPIVQERIRRGEQENASEERRKADVMLSEVVKLQREHQAGKEHSPIPTNSRYPNYAQTSKKPRYTPGYNWTGARITTIIGINVAERRHCLTIKGQATGSSRTPISWRGLTTVHHLVSCGPMATPDLANP